MKKLLTTACLFVVTISPLVLIPVNAQRETRQTVGLEKIDLSIVEKIRDEELKRSHMSDDAQYSMDVTALRLSRPPAMNQLAAGTRVLVHYDMEGMAGQDDWRSAAAWWPEQYARGQQLLAKDVNAVVAGLFDGGAEIVDVIDQHGSGNPGFNLPPELLDRRVRKHFHRHDASKAEATKYDAVLMVAMHAKTGSGGFMAHTSTFGIERIVNGRSVSEAEFGAYSWGDAGIPVIFVSGDDRLRDDLLAIMPWAEYVVTKRSISPQAVELRPVEVVRGELRAGAKRALQRLPQMKPLRATTPVRGGVRAVPPSDLSVLRDVPGINFSDGQVSFIAPTFAEAARGIIALQIVAVEMGGRPYVDEIFKRSPYWTAINRSMEKGFWEVWIELETDRFRRNARKP